MKKTILILLAGLLSLTLCACGGSGTSSGNPYQKPTESTEALSPEVEAILGEWVCGTDRQFVLVFNADGTCVTVNQDIVPYSVDPELNLISVFDSVTMNYSIVAENGFVQLVIQDTPYVREENYEAVHAEAIDAKISQMTAMLQDKTLLEFGTPYPLSEEFTITFQSAEFATHTTSHGDISGLWISVELDNLSDAELNWRNLPFLEPVSLFVQTGLNGAMSGDFHIAYEYNLDENGAAVIAFPAGETVSVRIPFYDGSLEPIKASADTFGYVLGYCTIPLGDTACCLDLTQIPVNN